MLKFINNYLHLFDFKSSYFQNAFIEIGIMKTITFIQLKSMNMINIWLSVEQAIFN